MASEYPDRPRVGVGVVVLRDQSVLLIRRKNPPRAGQWSIPGGGQDLGETIAEAGRREVYEETGVEVGDVTVVTVVDYIERDPDGQVRFHYVLVDLSAEWMRGEARAGDDATETAWFALDALQTLALWEETHRVIRLAAQMRAQARAGSAPPIVRDTTER